MAGPYNIAVGVTGSGVSRAGFGLPVQAAINDLDSRVSAQESDKLESWSKTASTNGTATASGSTALVRDATLGNLEAILEAGRRYKACMISRLSISASTATMVTITIVRKAGTGNPDPSVDTQITNSGIIMTTTGGVGQNTVYASQSFTVPSNGTYTFAAFVNNGSGTAVTCMMVGIRELLIEEIGPST
jgi:hypothetical protein